MTDATFPRTPRTTLKRYPQRAHYDRATVHRVLDDGYMCTIGFVHEGSPRVLPTGYGRIGDFIYVHGSNASTMLGAILKSPEICLSVTHVDGLVLGRSLFAHAVNYRSVVIFGRAERVTDDDEKRASFEAYAERFLKGRYADVRPPNQKELNSVTVVRISIDEAVAKLRSGSGIDLDEDLDRDCWAGLLYIKQSVCEVIRDPKGRQDVPPPPYVKNYERLPSKGDPTIINTAPKL